MKPSSSERRFFGLNIIELDLRERLTELFNAVAPEQVSVCVTDAEGRIVMSYFNGRFASDETHRPITDEFPDLKACFDPASTIQQQGDGKTYYANRVRFGARSLRAQIGIVAHIHMGHESRTTWGQLSRRELHFVW